MLGAVAERIKRAVLADGTIVNPFGMFHVATPFPSLGCLAFFGSEVKLESRQALANLGDTKYVVI